AGRPRRRRNGRRAPSARRCRGEARGRPWSGILTCRGGRGKPGSVTNVRIACAQLALRVGDLGSNLELMKNTIRARGAVETQIVLFPELPSPGYVFESRAEARSCGEPADGPTVSAWVVGAAHFGMVVIGGFAELGDDGSLYNSAAVVGPPWLAHRHAQTTPLEL